MYLDNGDRKHRFRKTSKKRYGCVCVCVCVYKVRRPCTSPARQRQFVSSAGGTALARAVGAQVARAENASRPRTSPARDRQFLSSAGGTALARAVGAQVARAENASRPRTSAAGDLQFLSSAGATTLARAVGEQAARANLAHGRQPRTPTVHARARQPRAWAPTTHSDSARARANPAHGRQPCTPTAHARQVPSALMGPHRIHNEASKKNGFRT